MAVKMVGINHTTAHVALRERLYCSTAMLETMLAEYAALPGVREVVVLSTCNRTEIFAECDDAHLLLRHLAARACLSFEDLLEITYAHEGASAASHLFRVASGLDSLVLGETQIIGQVRDALEVACAAGTVDRQLHALFQQALATGKRVRAETFISDGISSVGGAAVALAQQVVTRLGEHPILVLGAGKIAELTARRLAEQGATMILVANRTYAHAEELAERLGGRAISYQDLIPAISEVDVIISSTSAPHLVLYANEVAMAMHSRPERPLCLIDIAMPRDIDPAAAEVPNVRLYTLDDLSAVTESTCECRRAEAARAERIIEEELLRWRKRQAGAEVAPVITSLRRAGEQICVEELDSVAAALATLDPRQRQAVEQLAAALARRFTHLAITSLKEVSLANNDSDEELTCVTPGSASR